MILNKSDCYVGRLLKRMLSQRNIFSMNTLHHNPVFRPGEFKEWSVATNCGKGREGDFLGKSAYNTEVILQKLCSV